MNIFFEPLLFEWDRGNKGKNFLKHGVSNEECEEVFFDSKQRLVKDILHSGQETRYILLGQTERGRLLFIAFTIRIDKIRVISARDLNKKERRLYEEKN